MDQDVAGTQARNHPPSLGGFPPDIISSDVHALGVVIGGRWWHPQQSRGDALPGVGHFAADQAPDRVSELMLEHLRAHPV